MYYWMQIFFKDMKETKNVEHAIKFKKKIQISINSYTMAKNINAILKIFFINILV